MATKTVEQQESQCCELPAPVEETLLIRQRLRNLCELAIAIGQQEGLLTNHNDNEATDSEGGGSSCRPRE
ncbi:hypothetical protein ABFB09_07940 [Dehalogenimonas sp. THU2]|uniref:hypothetical protein n=1 Tax=Dehalogenimonas sp. THU2 TaxID=3151121 RepID=UPI00321877CC